MIKNNKLYAVEDLIKEEEEEEQKLKEKHELLENVIHDWDKFLRAIG